MTLDLTILFQSKFRLVNIQLGLLTLNTDMLHKIKINVKFRLVDLKLIYQHHIKYYNDENEKLLGKVMEFDICCSQYDVDKSDSIFTNINYDIYISS